MNFILKIVEGPNKGAEIALVDGVAVTLGKGDDCDIILADATLPDAPLRVEASDGGVLVDDERLSPYHVRVAGSTSFAVGPADAPWGDLVWPGNEGSAEERPAADEPAPAAADEPAAAEPAAKESDAEPAGRKRRGCAGCLVALLALVALAVAGWFFRARLEGQARERLGDEFVDSAQGFCRTWASRAYGCARGVFSRARGSSGQEEAACADTLDDVAARYGLAVSDEAGLAKLSGNLRTRAERLRATAEAYAARPGAVLDLSDDESFRVSADDALFTLTEGSLKVVSASNRVIAVSGEVRSAEDLRKVLAALSSDMPKLRDVDTSRVAMSPTARPAGAALPDSYAGPAAPASPVARKSASARKAQGLPDLPVCGILTTPYPCLVMRNGSRVMEGASIAGSVVLKIEPDAVVVTNSMGRFTWKP